MPQGSVKVCTAVTGIIIKIPYFVFHRIHPVLEANSLMEYVIQYFASDMRFPGDGQHAAAMVALYRDHICRTQSQFRSSLGWCCGVWAGIYINYRALPSYLLTPHPAPHS